MAMMTMMQKSYSCNESDNGDTNENIDGIDYIVNIDWYYCCYCYYLETQLEAEEVVVANDQAD